MSIDEETATYSKDTGTRGTVSKTVSRMKSNQTVTRGTHTRSKDSIERQTKESYNPFGSNIRLVQDFSKESLGDF